MEPPSGLSLFFRRFMDPAAQPAPCGPVDDGKLVVEADQRALSAPKEPTAGYTALSPLPPPTLPAMDILAMPDRDHLRTVEPDHDHLEYGG